MKWAVQQNSSTPTAEFFAVLEQGQVLFLTNMIVSIIAIFFGLFTIFLYIVVPNLRKYQSGHGFIMIMIFLCEMATNLSTFFIYPQSRADDTSEFSQILQQSTDPTTPDAQVLYTMFLCVPRVLLRFIGGLAVVCWSCLLSYDLVQFIKNPLQSGFGIGTRAWKKFIAYNCMVVFVCSLLGIYLLASLTSIMPGTCNFAPDSHVYIVVNLCIFLVLLLNVIFIGYAVVFFPTGFPASQYPRKLFVFRMVVFNFIILFFWVLRLIHRLNDFLLTRVTNQGFKDYTLVYKLFGNSATYSQQIWLSILLFTLDPIIQSRVYHLFCSAFCCCCGFCRKRQENEEEEKSVQLQENLLTERPKKNRFVEQVKKLSSRMYYEVIERDDSKNASKAAASNVKYLYIDFIVRRDVIACIMLGVTESVTDEDTSPLMEEDFTKIKNYHKIYSGTTKHSFKLREFCPKLMCQIRKIFSIQREEYLESFKIDTVIKDLILNNFSEGKSGSFFCITADGKYIIKTISSTELRVLMTIMKHLHSHYESNPDTLLVKILGIYELVMHKGFSIKYIVINNVFDTTKKIHQRFDLKGSWINRRSKPTASLKMDMDITEPFDLTDENFNSIMQQLDKDSDFLKSVNIMDYSLLLGVHIIDNNKNNEIYKAPSFEKKRGTTISLDYSFNMRKEEEEAEEEEQKRKRREFLEMQNEKGRKDSYNIRLDQGVPDSSFSRIYYIGIIDILQQYDGTKKMENFAKTKVLRRHPDGISAIDPIRYAHRFKEKMRTYFVSKSNVQKEEIEETTSLE